ncbi:MAG: rhodanese-like domain-containing protein [Methylococcales bacterium]|nr:rhodanese-like domain-containing protein [Methylococcales bacterium]
MPCDQIKSIVDDGGVLVDVRSPMEYASGSLNGARNIPLAGLPNFMDDLPKDKPVLLFCVSGARSGAAQRYLAQQGYDAHNIGAYASYRHC